MHEVGIAAEIVRIVEESAKEAGIHAVTRIKVIIGDRRMVKSDALLFAFSCLKQHSCAASAILEIENTSGRDLYVQFLEGE